MNGKHFEHIFRKHLCLSACFTLCGLSAVDKMGITSVQRDVCLHFLQDIAYHTAATSTLKASTVGKFWDYHKLQIIS